MTSWGCSHTFTFHDELQGATNIHCDEVLTVPWSQLCMRKSALCYPRPLTGFCAYLLMRKMPCDSARTRVTTALMSIAMASILKVFFMRKRKARAKCYAKGQKAAGEVTRGQSQGELGEELECDCWDVLGRCARSYMHVRWQCAILFQVRRTENLLFCL